MRCSHRSRRSYARIEPLDLQNLIVDETMQSVSHSVRTHELVSRTKGLVGGWQRAIEVYESFEGMHLKVEGAGEFIIDSSGPSIRKSNLQEELTQLDREIILGPALVLALAMRNTWSLHASAAMFRDQVFVFLGESGQGKSTLAAYLSQSAGWRLVADDILPVKIDSIRVSVLPHFPQLKLPLDAQPGSELPEKLSLSKVCLLMSTENDPELELIPAKQAVHAWLTHTAGTRLFDSSLLAGHLDFCGRAAVRHPVYRLAYPHRRDALPAIKCLLESVC